MMRATQSEKARPFSIYLLKSAITGAEKAVKSDVGIKHASIPLGGGRVGKLYYRQSPARAPRWVDLFRPHVNPKDFLSSSASAVLIVSAGSRLFALSFGYGRHILDPSSYEPDFGLKVTLNSVDPDEVRTVDRQVLDSTGRHSREQASRNIPIIEFGLDIDKDILREVTGPPEDLSLGTRLAGSDALSVVTAMELASIPERLEKYLGQFRKKRYRESFPWVDNIREVHEAEVKDDLDAELVTRIEHGDLDRMWLAVPDLVDWHDVRGFTYSNSEKAAEYDDISFETYISSLRKSSDTSIEALHRHRVFCISAETDAPKAAWPIYKCIYAEIDRGGKTYLLTAGRWYAVAVDYVKEVDNALRAIKASSTLGLPIFDEQSEEAYNKKAVKLNPAFALMDRKMIQYGGGRSKLEFCDLYSKKREMVHVKRYSGSGALSHLFAQGMVAARVFVNDQKFRQKVNGLLPSSHKLSSPKAEVRTDQYEVAYVIASKAVGALVLPFFSRVTLRSAYSQLRNMNYRVTLTKVQCK